MKKTSALFLLALLVGCGVSKQTYTVADVTKPEAITLKKQSGQGNIHSMTVVAKGHLDGDAEIVLILNGTANKWITNFQMDMAHHSNPRLPSENHRENDCIGLQCNRLRPV